MIERRWVDAWLGAQQSARPSILAQCDQRLAIAKITEYSTYYADLTYLNWRDGDEASRRAQWRYYMADAAIASKGTVTVSNDNTAVGSGAVSATFAAGDNV